MGVRFGAYEKTYSTDSVASISAAFVACVVASVSFGFVLVRVRVHISSIERLGFSYLRKFGLLMHVGRGGTAS